MASSANDRPNDEPFFEEGCVLGDYRIERRIGAGAMAVVFLARQRSLDRSVALKILRPNPTGGDSWLRRFIQEAQAAARLEHSNIVRIYEVGEFRAGKQNRLRFFRSRSAAVYHYIAEEYVSGMNLQFWLRCHGPLEPAQTVRVVSRVAEALQAAADAGIVHRDIKPENILLSSSGEVKVADFGLACFSASEQENHQSLTQIGTTLGTPFYMSPEQAESRPLDTRSDIYSLGITAFQTLTGKVPFTGSTALAVLLAHLNAPPPSLAELRPDLPAELVRIVERMIAKKPSERYASPKELLADLSQIENSSDVSASKIAAPVFDAADRDHSLFQSRSEGLERTCRLQTSLAAAELYRGRRSRNFLFSRRFFFAAFFALAVAFVAGAVFFCLFLPEAIRPAAPVIHRFETVEEQWVFAAQLGTDSAWQSVIDYFPDQPYWTRRALEQKARALILQGEAKKAQGIFEQFARSAPSDRRSVTFGLAGLAWCLAVDGRIDAAGALLSELRSNQKEPFDRITEEIISRAGEQIRKRSASF